MARKPAHLASAGGKTTGRQGIWEAIRAMRTGITVKALSVATDIHEATIRTYFNGLVAAGYIAEGALVRDTGIEAPRVTRDGRPVTQGAAREQMWRTMRMLSGDWSWRDLAVAASTEAVPVAEADAADYCAHLAKAGYLAVTDCGRGAVKGVKGGGAPTRYRFVRARYSGPKPPQVQRVQSVYDPNLRRVVWFGGRRHED
jgi:hypothetical protein